MKIYSFDPKTLLFRRLVPALLLLGLFSCRAYQEPEFKYIKNIKLAKFDQEEVELQADAVLYNPNRVPLTLTEIDLSLTVNAIQVNNIRQLRKSKIKPRQDFEVPLSITFPTKRLFNNFLTALQYAATNKSIDVEYEGVIKMRAAGVKFKVPVDYVGELNFK